MGLLSEIGGAIGLSLGGPAGAYIGQMIGGSIESGGSSGGGGGLPIDSLGLEQMFGPLASLFGGSRDHRNIVREHPGTYRVHEHPHCGTYPPVYSTDYPVQSSDDSEYYPPRGNVNVSTHDKEGKVNGSVSYQAGNMDSMSSTAEKLMQSDSMTDQLAGQRLAMRADKIFTLRSDLEKKKTEAALLSITNWANARA